MNRREVLEKSALALGYAITGPTLLGLMNGCKAKPGVTFKPEFLNNDQAVLVSELAEIIIPKTDTPGAIDAGVPSFIDGMLKEVYNKSQKENFLKGLSTFDDEAKKTYGNNFVNCTLEEKKSFFKKAHDELLSKSKGNDGWAWWRYGGKEGKPFIIEMKELTITGFFTSEVGATQVLQYNQVPGPFRGCVPLSEVGKTWAT
jgi:hypothetical protein